MHNLLILQKQSVVSISEFVGHWRKIYTDLNEDKYHKNINIDIFQKTNLEELFHWKNAMTLKGSGFKEISFQSKILNRINLINEYKQLVSIDLTKFNNDFADVSAVWRIFLLHIISPKVYPIYDQHIHRAYNFIHNKEWQIINNNISDKKKLEFYYKTYFPYVQDLGIANIKEFDEAFFAFGQFLKTKKYSLLVQDI